MRARKIFLLVVIVAALMAGLPVVVGDMPVSDFLIVASIAAGISAAAVALGTFLKRWEDRSTLRGLSRGGAPGTEDAVFEVRREMGRYERGQGIVRTAVASDVKWFYFYDLKQSAGWRLFKRLGLSHRLAIDDEEFNREIYVERNPEVGTKLLASAESREAARATFRLGFFLIEYRHGVLSAHRWGEVPDDVAAAVRPHLLVLARSASEVAHVPQGASFAGSGASAWVGQTVQTQKEHLIPTRLLVLDVAGCVLLGLGLAKQFGAIDTIPVQFRFQGYGMAFIVAGIVIMAPALIGVITKVKERGRAESRRKP
jgi:hypothetical protein